MKSKTRISHPASRIIWFLGLCYLSTVCSVQAVDWVELKNCKLVENQSNDGDSFVVECATAYRGEAKNRFRLYFVDTAETDANSDFKKERLKEQAAYWENSDPDFAMRMGMRAEQTVKKWMRFGFTVYTQGEYAPSLGAPRYYALIRINDRWLDELLAEEGLVRIYGDGTDLPDGTDEKNHWRKLHELERAARSENRNGWRAASEAAAEVPQVFSPHDAVLKSTAWIYSLKDGRKIFVLGKGTLVTVLAPADNAQMRIRFEKNGKVYEGLCSKRNLDL